MSSLPVAPNSGQYRAIGASRSTRPRSTSPCAAGIADSRCEEPEARRALPAPLLAEDVGVPRVGDLPGARRLDVAVVVIGPDAHRALLCDVEEVVVERPRAACRRLARELDLGMMPVVDGHRPRLPPERLAEEAQDGL